MLTMYKSCNFRDTPRSPRAIIVYPLSKSLRSTTLPIIRKSKCTSVSLPPPTLHKYNFHLITFPPSQQDDFIEKLEEGDEHYDLTHQCTFYG